MVEILTSPVTYWISVILSLFPLIISVSKDAEELIDFNYVDAEKYLKHVLHLIFSFVPFLNYCIALVVLGFIIIYLAALIINFFRNEF
jgi:hypothetical protein